VQKVKGRNAGIARRLPTICPVVTEGVLRMCTSKGFYDKDYEIISFVPDSMFEERISFEKIRCRPYTSAKT
jgi:hypothetical protein